MASFFDNLGQKIDQGIAGLYNRDQIVDLENQYINEYGLQQTGTGIGSDARHMSAMNNLSNTLSKSGLGIAMGLPSEFAGDIGAFGAGLINEIPALARGFNKKNFGEIGEDIAANFRGSFRTPNSTTAKDIYSQVFSGIGPQRFASGAPMGYGTAQASDLTDLERDFPGMSTGDIIDSMNNRPFIGNQQTGIMQQAPQGFFDDNYGQYFDSLNSETDDEQVDYLPGQSSFKDKISNIGNSFMQKTGIGGLLGLITGNPILGLIGRGIGALANRARPALNDFKSASTGAQFFQNLRDRRAREDAAARGAAKANMAEARAITNRINTGRTERGPNENTGGGIGSSVGGGASPGSAGPGGSDTEGSF